MNTKLKGSLENILSTIIEIESFLAKSSKAKGFKNNLQKRAIERDIETIGLEMNSIKKSKTPIHFYDAEDFISIKKKLQNRKETNDETLWGLIRRRTMSRIKKEVKQHLANDN